jgi:hypothetical protein
VAEESRRPSRRWWRRGEGTGEEEPTAATWGSGWGKQSPEKNLIILPVYSEGWLSRGPTEEAARAGWGSNSGSGWQKPAVQQALAGGSSRQAAVVE